MTEGIAYRGPMTLNADTLPTLLDRIRTHTGMIACDTETISIKDKTCLGIGIALSEEEAVYFQVLPYLSPHIDILTHVLCNPNVMVIYHNALFDLEVESIVGEIWGWPPVNMTNIADTSSMARVQALPAGLHTLTMMLLNRYIMTYEELIMDGTDRKKHPLDIDWSKVADKCLQDCLATFGIFPHLW